MRKILFWAIIFAVAGVALAFFIMPDWLFQKDGAATVFLIKNSLLWALGGAIYGALKRPYKIF